MAYVSVVVITTALQGNHLITTYPASSDFPCRVQTCGINQHFSSICPVVYERAKGPIPCSTTASHSNDNTEPRPAGGTASVSTVTSKGRFQGTLPNVMGYLRWDNQRYLLRILLDGGSQAPLLREGIIPRMADCDSYQDYDLILVGGSKINRS